MGSRQVRLQTYREEKYTLADKTLAWSSVKQADSSADSAHQAFATVLLQMGHVYCRMQHLGFQ